MANAQGGQGQTRGQGGHGQTFTSAQHDASLGRRSEGPGVKEEGAAISVPEGGLGDSASAYHSDMADPTRGESRAFPADENTSGEGSPDQARDEAQARAPDDEDVEDAGAAMDAQVAQTTGQSFGAG